MKPFFENPKIGFYGHHIKYNLHVLSQYGIHIPTIILTPFWHLILLNSHNRQHSLDNLALEYFGKVKMAIGDLVGKGKKIITMRDVPIEQVVPIVAKILISLLASKKFWKNNSKSATFIIYCKKLNCHY